MRSILVLALATACAARPSQPSTPPIERRANASSPTATPVDAERPATSSTPELDAITIPPRPDWTDKYAEAGPDQRRFVISSVMERHGLTRVQAIEAQNHFRDLARATPNADLDALLEQAIARAKADGFEDRRDLARIAAAKFIVVFDLDDTLYDQYAPENPGCRDFEVALPDGARGIKLVPAWEATIRRIVELGGAVVLYSANTDDRTWANGRAWLIDGVPIVESPLVSAFLTNSHLVQQDKREGPPVQEPSKDLRVVDETLERVIIIDDNPGRIFHHANLRLFKKFHAGEYCATKDATVRRAYEHALPRVLWEIEDSVRYMKAHPDVDFATAYRPFTALGRIALDLLRETTRMSETKAVAWLRTHPELIDTDF